MAGNWGSLQLPYQGFVVAYRPAGTGVPSVGGYEDSVGAYDTASALEYIEPSMVTGAVTDADIYQAVDSVRVAGTVLWTNISS